MTTPPLKADVTAAERLLKAAVRRAVTLYDFFDGRISEPTS